MPQPKSSRSSGTRASSSTSKRAASKSSSKSATTAKSGAAGRSKAAAKGGKATAARRGASGRTTAAAKGGGTTAARQRSTATAAATAAATSDQAAHANLQALRDLLRRGVVLSTDGVKTAMDDAVKRGQLTRKDATQLSKTLIASGRAQADGFRSDLEAIVGKGRSRATQSGDRVLREVDRARRRVGVGPSFPITLYDDLNATQVQGRLNDLSSAQLRKVRDYERRNANRKSVLGAIERKLG